VLNQKTNHDISINISYITRRYSSKHRYLNSFLSTNPEGLKTNIIAENFDRQIQRRLKTIESFQTVATAFDYLNMIINHIRFDLLSAGKEIGNIEMGSLLSKSAKSNRILAIE
jgi:hypothetical protein